nr:exodeoxyribonuclease V subunit beta [Marinobacter zhejiangensis]
MSALNPLTLPLRGSQLIEASAGTGKTFTIAMLYVRAVLGHGEVPECGRPLTPRDILVVTFTDAATKELRDRIRKRLAEAAAVFREPPGQMGGSGPLYDLRNDYPDTESWPGKARLLQLAAESMDEASVHTIHGWCNRMLTEHAFDSGGLFNQSLETDHSDLMLLVVKDYWRSYVATMDAGVANLWLDQFPSPDALRDKVSGLLALEGELPQAPDSPGALLDARVESLREVFDQIRPSIASAADDFLAVLRDAASRKEFNGNSLRLKNVEGWLGKLVEWAASQDLSAPELTDAAWARLSPTGIEQAWKKGVCPADHPLIQQVVALNEVCQEPVPVKQMLFHAAHWIAERLEREKQRRAELGFDDLLVRMDRALSGASGSRLSNAIRQQFPLVMIDEFQDTDPVQYRIFDTIYRPEANRPESGLLMIGDPKQAIYGFRGADIYTYLKARVATADRQVTLPRNFRSAASMVEATNHLFRHGEASGAKGAFLFGRGNDTPVPFIPVEANGRGEHLQIDGKASAALTFWTRESEDNKSEAMADVAGACASEIVRLLNQGQTGQAAFVGDNGSREALKARDIAVLVNSGTEAELVRTELALRGVKSVYLSDRRSVLDSAEARDIIYWLEACAEPERDDLVRAALATATLAVDWATLDQLRNNELAWETELEQFRSFRNIWRRQGVLAMLRRLLTHFDVPARLLASRAGERTLTDVLHLAELLQQESQQVDGEQSLIRRFSEMVTARGERADAMQVRLESDAELVQVITVHKSKGLEYPLVFLPFATSCRPAKGQRLPLIWHDDDGNQQLAFEPRDEIIGRMDEERLGEDVRKLYVALTRARHATWVGAPALKGEEARSALSYLVGQQPGQQVSSGLEQLAGTCPEIRVQPLPPATDAVYAAPETPALGHARTRTAPDWHDWWIASYSAIRYRSEQPALGAQASRNESESPGEERIREESDAANREAPPPLPNPAPTTHAIHRFYRGAEPGTFLHDLLEWAAKEGFRETADNPEARLEYITHRCQLRGWEPWAEPLGHWMGALLTMPMSLPVQPTGHKPEASLATLAQAVPEMEFWLSSHGVDVSELDRLVRPQTMTRWNSQQIPKRPQADNMMFNGMLKGFIDLVFEHEGRYYVADYKSNFIGPDDDDYSEVAMAKVIAEKRYDLQFTLYLLALHRLLKSRLPDYDYDRHIGGAVYLFLRGNNADSQGVYCERPDRSLIEALDCLFRTGDAGRTGEMTQEALL